MKPEQLLAQIKKPVGYLMAFALSGTLILALIHSLTAERIRQNERNALLQRIDQLVPAEHYNNDPLMDTVMLENDEIPASSAVTVYRARQDLHPIAAVYAVDSPNGYSGTIRLVVGVKTDQTLAGVRVVSHKETPGLGDRIEVTKSDWILSFNGKSLNNPPLEKWAVKRDGGNFDQFTGATITPRAIVGTVKDVLVWSQQHQTALFEHPASPGREHKP